MMVEVRNLNSQSIPHGVYCRKVLTGRMPTCHKDQQSSQARPTSRHTLWVRYRVVLMLLSCSMTWVNNHAHYLAFTEKIVDSSVASVSLWSTREPVTWAEKWWFLAGGGILGSYWQFAWDYMFWRILCKENGLQRW